MFAAVIEQNAACVVKAYSRSQVSTVHTLTLDVQNSKLIN